MLKQHSTFSVEMNALSAYFIYWMYKMQSALMFLFFMFMKYTKCISKTPVMDTLLSCE